MKRISNEMIDDAFRATGFRPTQHVFHDPAFVCCGVTALVAQRHGVIKAMKTLDAEDVVINLNRLEALLPEFDRDYLLGLIAGWDLNPLVIEDQHEWNDRHEQGYDDGKRAFQYVDQMEID